MHNNIATDFVPSVDVSRERLTRSGWTVRCSGHSDITGLVFVVHGSLGDRRIRAEGTSAAMAWHRAVVQAAAVGMLESARR